MAGEVKMHQRAHGCGGHAVPRVALPLVLALTSVGIACHQPDCDSLAPGTPVTDLTFTSSGSVLGPCHPELQVQLGCCERTDAGSLQCFPLATTCEFRWVSHDSYGGECDGDREAGDPYGRLFCGVWIRDGRVVGVCSQCEFD